MNIFNKLISYVLWGIFIFLITMISLTIFSNIVPNLNHSLLQSGIVAFFGAFFAFMFVMIEEMVRLKRKDNVNHFNSLVSTERYLHKLISRMEQIILIFNLNLEGLKQKNIVAWEYQKISINNDLMESVRTIDFINDFYSLSTDIEIFSRDFLSLKSNYDEIKNCYFIKVLTPEAYEKNLAHFVKKIEMIFPYLEHSREEAIRLISILRLLLGEKRIKTLFFFIPPRKHYKKNFEDEIKLEIAEYKKELDESRAESQKEKDSIAKENAKKEEDSENKADFQKK